MYYTIKTSLSNNIEESETYGKTGAYEGNVCMYRQHV